MGSGSSTASIEFSVRGSHESRSMSTQPEGNFETVLISSDSELDTMASKEGESSSGSSKASIEFSVRGSHESRSMSTQTEGNFETVFISSDSEPSGNSETTSRTETTKDPLCGNVSPLMFESQYTESSNVGTQSEEPSENSEPTTQDPFCVNVARPLIFESQYTESSNVGTQSEDPNKCRQIFAIESDTQCNFVWVCPENADETNEDADESNENADDSNDTVIYETSDFNTNTGLLSYAESEPSDNTQNTQTLSQYVKGPDTQDNSLEMYPDTLSQSSEPLIRSDRRREQIYEFASEACSDPLDSTYVRPACEIPLPITRQDAITPSTSSKHDLDSTEVDSDENKPPKKKKKKKLSIFVVQNKTFCSQYL